MSYADKTMACRDCGTDFVFTAGEQEFYAQKGFTNEPTR
ncbi:MAG: zinc-ribbon domain-containing protein, partial [Chloroflexota bacterium]|nr:zinc-ribbon domain-containing protein [Chloroflexota bacterium]